jgi:hypothetical protein
VSNFSYSNNFLKNHACNTKENNKESSSKLAKQGLRLSNFFRSVKFPRNKKIIQTAPIRIFGRELNDLVKATNQEGTVVKT